MLAKLEALIHVMKEIGDTHNATSAQVAIAWAIAKGTVPIIGVTRTSQIADAVKAAEITLTAQEIHDLEAAVKAGKIRCINHYNPSIRITEPFRGNYRETVF
ncbi:aldo/keto reductase [Cohnella candidum]|uniref:aldo/keto reductase n=1 Tax=Cohnella candidum TaxID=2674991 RepID=UPI0030B9538F